MGKRLRWDIPQSTPRSEQFYTVPLVSRPLPQETERTGDKLFEIYLENNLKEFRMIDQSERAPSLFGC